MRFSNIDDCEKFKYKPAEFGSDKLVEIRTGYRGNANKQIHQPTAYHFDLPVGK